MGLSHSPGIIPDGLVFYFDPINPRSYAGTGLTGYNLIDTSIVGSFVGGAVYDIANKGSIYFDGSDDYINIPNATSLNPTTITISCWVKFKTFTNNANIISKGFTSVSSPFIQYSLKMGDVESTRDLYGFQISNNGVNATVTSSARLITNKYYFLTVTYDGTTLKLYKDGVQDVNTTTSAGALASYATPVQIGRWGTQGSQYFNGNVAAAIIYNRALSSTEILQNYNATKKRFSPEENIVLDGLILEFDAGNSSSYSGIGNTGYTVAGAGVTASLINGTSFSTLNGGSFVFDGSNDHIILNDFYLTQTNSSNEYTIMASGKLATISTGVRQLVSSDSGGYDWSFGAAGTGYFIFTGAGSTTASTQDLNWHIFAAQWSSAGSRLYLDNSLLINTTVAYDAGINQTFIGKNPTVGFGEYWNGNVGTVLIYNRILTTQELTQNYNALKGRYGLS